MFVSSLFPPAAVIWKSCITILSLKTVLGTPSSYKEEMYWELPQNSIFWIGFKLQFLFISPAVAWPGLFALALASLSPSKPAARNPSPSYPAGQPATTATQTCSWSFSNPSKAVGFVSDYPQSGGRPLPQSAPQEALNFPSSKLSDQPECIRKYIYFTSPLFHFLVLPWFLKQRSK